MLKLLFGITMDPLLADEYPPGRLAEYTATGKTIEGYNICHCKPQHQPCLTVFIQGLGFKCKTTYISTESFDVMYTAETLVDREMHWNWAKWMFNSISIDIKTMQTKVTTISPSAEVLDLVLGSYFPSTEPGYKHVAVAQQNTNDQHRQSENSKKNSHSPDYILEEGGLGADRGSKAPIPPPRQVDQRETSTAQLTGQPSTSSTVPPTVDPLPPPIRPTLS